MKVVLDYLPAALITPIAVVVALSIGFWITLLWKHIKVRVSRFAIMRRSLAGVPVSRTDYGYAGPEAQD